MIQKRSHFFGCVKHFYLVLSVKNINKVLPSLITLKDAYALCLSVECITLVDELIIPENQVPDYLYIDPQTFCYN